MAEQPNEQTDVVEEEQVDVVQDEHTEAVEEEQVDIVQDETNTVTPPQNLDEGYVVPRGAIAFGIIMIIGYAFYFFMIWSEVVARGGQ